MTPDIPSSYKEAKAIMAGARDQSLGRPVANNTRLEWTDAARTELGVRLHNTVIANFKPNGGIELDTGGWHTVTTKDRLNRCIPHPWAIYSHRVKKDVYPESWIHFEGWPVCPLVDGMELRGNTIRYLDSVLMSEKDIRAEIERLQAERDAKADKHRARLVKQHLKFADLAAAMERYQYDWQTRTSEVVVVPVFHPNSYDGQANGCPLCKLYREEDDAAV